MVKHMEDAANFCTLRIKNSVAANRKKLFAKPRVLLYNKNAQTFFKKRYAAGQSAAKKALKKRPVGGKDA